MDKKPRRKSSSHSPATNLNTSKSPAPALAIKRSDTAPVTLRGWLYKQGSDGLQLWKKRWFVLSEYCLFYYKDSNEEKVLGSILLPSYTISPLSKDDGVFRKYAFKAEHAGMRTYFFAAETKDSMLQWMNNMSLASILQNENKLRPELLSRELARQGQHSRQSRPFNQQQFRQAVPNNVGHQRNGHQGYQQQHIAPVHNEGRQPLYANAPPKPRRLNTSRDYSPSPDNSPERLSHSNFSPEQEMSQHLPHHDLPQFRHRLPQERRTPEAYGRSRFDNSINNAKYPTKDYEEVYNNAAYEYNNDRQLSEEVAAYNDQRRLSHGAMIGPNRNLQRIPPQQNADDGNFNHQRQVSGAKIPRPHSADFLEYERSHPNNVFYPGQGSVTLRNEPQVARSQPQRPKSCIGEKLRPDDFWSEESYAQKMRESVKESRSRPQSRASHVVHQNKYYADQQAVPPPVHYQDQGQQYQHSNSSYLEDQEVANNNFQQSYHPQQPQHAMRMTPGVYRNPPNYPQYPPQPQFVQSPVTNNHFDTQHQQQRIINGPHFTNGVTPVQMSTPNNNYQQQYNNNTGYSPHQQQQPYQQQHFRGYYDQQQDPKITVPPSIPQPLPRKQQNVLTPTTYQNIPANSKSFSDPRPVSVCRIETATPSGRFADKMEPDPQDFRRSASARLPKQKNRGNDFMNNTLSGESDDSKKNGDPVGREESMKRLLNWKQRMLQSPLTRKSSRNASRTQTPTNSDSPVPSLNDDIRKRVLEELQVNEPSSQQQTVSTNTREKRLSRKGSSGSRSSRSRSSPRIAPSKNQLVSSDDEEIGDPRQARKRNRSQQSRSRNSSKENLKKSPNSKSEQTVKSRSRSVSCISPTSLDQQQPEYINISSVKSFNEPGDNIDLSWTSKIKASHTIGPDDWYRDDFDFDKSHPFLDDPMLLKQYAQILDMKYRDSSNEKIEEILIQNSLVHQADMERGMFENRNVVGNGPSPGQERTKKVVSGEGDTRQFSVGRYPDSGYDTLQPLDFTADKQQLCTDVDTERKSDSFVFTEYDKQFLPSHPPGSHFSDFQLLNKGGDETVLLTIEGHGENLERNVRTSTRQREADKIIWQVGTSSYKDIREEKEAPPKNVVKDRLKNFESGGVEDDKSAGLVASGSSNKIHQNTTPSADQNAKLTKKYPDFSFSSDEESEPILEKKLEHKKSVKDLLSDFEKKSKELQQKEKEHQGGIGSYLLKDTKESAGQRRVCSDTETMNYATSSDDDDDDFGPPHTGRKIVNNNDLELKPSAAATEGCSDSFIHQHNVMQADKLPNEETYLAMTPARSLSSLQAVSRVHNSVTSLASSSHASSQSITSPTLQRFNSVDKKLGSPILTPSEVLTQSVAARDSSHNRTPSQTLVMEHLQTGASNLEEETYVDMNEDGSRLETPRGRHKEPVLARSYKAENDEDMNNTLTLEDPESPKYHEIEETEEGHSQPHYELLSNARTSRQPQYEALYHEISENNSAASPTAASTPMKKKEPTPLRPIEGLPDILGNAPTNKGNSSSDADDESSKDFDAIETKPHQTISLDDSFRPASFYLSRCKNGSKENDDADSSDSDLVSPPSVPSSPPPMEEVLGFTSSSNFDAINYSSEGMNTVFTAAARSSSALRERSRLDSVEDSPRRQSVGSRGSFVSQQSNSQQSINREVTKSPLKLHGSHQSLGSRELPPIPNQNLQGSQQSLASREIQQIGSSQHLSNENIFRNSPYHSREGSLDNEAFLFHKFTQGTSISDYYKRHGSDSADLSSSDTANYEQEYRRYHLENIQEVSNTLERSDSGAGAHNTSIISQELNIGYNSVYDSRLQGKDKPEEDHHPQQHQQHYQPELEQQRVARAEQVVSPRSKIPYYMSDIMKDGTVVKREKVEERGESSSQSLGVVDAITKSMNALDVESKSYFEEKNDKENERIKMLRRSYTPDPYFSKTGGVEPGSQPSSQDGGQHFESNNVSRSKSLEGLLGDTQGGPKDNIGYARQTPVFNSRPPSSTAKRGPPPPPPAGVPPLDITPLTSPTQHMAMMTQAQSHNNYHHLSSHDSMTTSDDHCARSEDEVWADSLRRASLRQRAQSHDSVEEARLVSVRTPVLQQQQAARVPPPTAPKPKTPVHMLHHTNNSYPPDMLGNISHSHQANELSGHMMPAARQYHHGTGPGQSMQEFSSPPAHHYNPSWQQPGHGHHQQMPVTVQRNSTVSHHRNIMAEQNFLDSGLPATIDGQQQQPPVQRRSLSRPASRGPVSPAGGRQQPDQRSMTLPARGRQTSQDHSGHRDSVILMDSFDSDNSPRTRTSKSGLHEDSQPVPPSPAPTAQQNMQNNIPDPSLSSHKDFSSHQNYRDANNENMMRSRRRSNSLGRKSADLEMLKQKFGGNLANITAGDLLNKSQEELVLILIQLRRQSASLAESIDACKAEQDNLRNMGQQPSIDLRQSVWELEEEVARINPVINLVDNMVKLGTLYRGNDDAPLSQRLQHMRQDARKGSNVQQSQIIDQESVERQQLMLEKELAKVQNQLKISHKALVENGSDMSRFEKDMNALSQEFHNSVQRDRSRGGQSSRSTINIETDMRMMLQKTADLQKVRQNMMQHIQTLQQQEHYLMDEIRKAPTGVSGAEQLPPKQKYRNTWCETDIDNNYTKDRGPETEQQIAMETRNIGKPGSMYVNAAGNGYSHNYENFDTYENFKNNLARNPYEDDVQTVHSEGVRSEMEGPPLPDRPNNHVNNEDIMLGLGELGDADEKIQRYYGILPKEKPIEIKTVRMVKRDNKERSVSRTKRTSEDDSESVELSLDEEEPAPAPLPRGNYQNLHNFLSNKPYTDNLTTNYNPPHSNNHQTNSAKTKQNNMENGFRNGDVVPRRDSSEQRPMFKVGEMMSHRMSSDSLPRPGSSMSAHERLFGTSRDSLSPEASPVKSSSMVSTDSNQSAIMSPVFKSAAARAIIEEERKTPMIIPKAKKKGKKRHMTITSSHPAVLEAINRHEAKMDLRSRDDMDIERTLKQPSDAPDLVQSTFGQNEQNSEIRSNAIDNLFGVPDKIQIPERYVPDQTEEASPEERKTRLKKADSIRRMLADSSATPVVKRKESDKEIPMSEEKRQREQLLALNQVLAQQVLQKSRSVSVPRE